MSTAYCATVLELRDEIASNGIDPRVGGFFLLSDYPDVDESVFDVWEVEIPTSHADVGPLMVSQPISPMQINLMTATSSLRMAG